MSASNDIDAERPGDPSLFSALLVPHRAMSYRAFNILMLVLGGFSFMMGVIFISMGAWPVFGFLGLDVLAVWWAFRVNYRRANACEEITVTPTELRVRRVNHKGQVSGFTLNPLWTRIDKDTDVDYGIERLYLVSRGRRESVANYLGPDEKESFAKALMDALHLAKRGPTLNPLT